jgi:hypothetical protein
MAHLGTIQNISTTIIIIIIIIIITHARTQVVQKEAEKKLKYKNTRV